jgi:hypothetical protein
MKGLSDHLNDLFKELDHKDSIGVSSPLIFFKEEEHNRYRCFSPKYFEMYNISFGYGVDGMTEYISIATVNQLSDYFTTLVVYLTDDDSVFSEQRSIGPDQKQIDAMKDIIKFFKNVCQNMWYNDKQLEKAVAAGYMDKNGFLNRDDIDVDIF